MTTISSYTTQSGVRYRVRYRKPDGSQTDIAYENARLLPGRAPDVACASRGGVVRLHAGRPAFHFQANTESLESGRFVAVAVRSSAFQANKLRSRFGVNEQNRTLLNTLNMTSA